MIQRPLLYLAGGEPAWREVLEGKHLLISFAEPRQLAILDVEDWQSPGILVDSGAYSMWSGRAVIDIGAYIEFCHKYRQKLDGYFVLDQMPGTPEAPPDKLGYTGAAETSYDNWMTMREAGLDPIPVFHYGESSEFLEEYCVECEVVGLSGGPMRGKPQMFEWLMAIYATYPNQKFHVLGVTNTDLMAYFPFYSVDSVTWQAYAWYGGKSNQKLLRKRSPEFYAKYAPEMLDAATISKQPYPWKRRLGIDALEDALDHRDQLPIRFNAGGPLARSYLDRRVLRRAPYSDYMFTRRYGYDPYDRTGVDD